MIWVCSEPFLCELHCFDLTTYSVKKSEVMKLKSHDSKHMTYRMWSRKKNNRIIWNYLVIAILTYSPSWRTKVQTAVPLSNLVRLWIVLNNYMFCIPMSHFSVLMIIKNKKKYLLEVAWYIHAYLRSHWTIKTNLNQVACWPHRCDLPKGPSIYYVSIILEFFWPTHPLFQQCWPSAKLAIF